MHEEEGSVIEVREDSIGYVIQYEGGRTRVKSSVDPSRSRATPIILPEHLPFCHDYGCVEMRAKGSFPVVHVIMLMTLYCLAQEERRLKRNLKSIEKDCERQGDEDQ